MEGETFSQKPRQGKRSRLGVLWFYLGLLKKQNKEPLSQWRDGEAVRQRPGDGSKHSCDF